MSQVNKIISLKNKNLNLIALLSDDIICEFIVEDLTKPTIGSIYSGVVRSKAEAEKAYLVEYQKDLLGYLKSPQKKLSIGEKLTVMIKKTGAGKVPELTTNISIAGSFIIYKPYESELLAFSKKLDKTLQENLRTKILSKDVNNKGFIVRSSAQYTDILNIMAELEILSNFNEVIKTNSKSLTCLYQKNNWLEELIASLAPDISYIATNNITELNQIKKLYQKSFTNLTPLIEHSTSRQIFNDYDIMESLEKALSSKVSITPKGELNIIQTPALTAVDVDSKGAKNDDSFLKSWVLETVLQIKLRNLSGKIIIDPPFLPDKNHFKKIITLFKSLLANDSVNSYVAGISPLGNIEIARERIKPTILEILCGSDSIYGNAFQESAFDNFINKLLEND